MKEKIENLLLSLPKENDSFYLIDYNVGYRRKTWDAEYNENDYDEVFEMKFSIEGKDVFVLVGANYLN